MRKIVAAVALMAIGFPAAASDYSGAATMLIGIPAFLAFDVMLAIFIVLPASRFRRALASVGITLLAILGIAVTGDAIETFDRPSPDWLIGGAFFLLAGLSLFLFNHLLSKAAGAPSER
ncbi:hypothetical protein [Lysobacter fragariae]